MLFRSASYRVVLGGLHKQEVADASGTVTSAVPWMMTRTHAGSDYEADSDVRDNLSGIEERYHLVGRDAISADLDGVRGLEGQVILAAPRDAAVPAGDQTVQQAVSAGEVIENAEDSVIYDMLSARKPADEAYDGGDAGQLPVPTRSLEGLVWRDANYDGLQDTKTTEQITLPDGTAATKLVEEGLVDQVITLEQWYYDPANVNPDSAPAFLTPDYDRDELNLSGKIDPAYDTSHWFRNENFGDRKSTRLNSSHDN